MLKMRFKESTKFKSYGKCDLLRKQLCVEEAGLVQQKIDYKNYINEIFAGLMWLG